MPCGPPLMTTSSALAIASAERLPLASGRTPRAQIDRWRSNQSSVRRQASSALAGW